MASSAAGGKRLAAGAPQPADIAGSGAIGHMQVGASHVHRSRRSAVDVEKMWITSGFPVKSPTGQFFFRRVPETNRLDAECACTFVGRFA